MKTKLNLLNDRDLKKQLRKPLRTTLHSLQNSVINSSDELKSLAHTGVDANGALWQKQVYHSDLIYKNMQVLITSVIKEMRIIRPRNVNANIKLRFDNFFHV